MSDTPASTPPNAPRYRYFTVAPRSLTLPPAILLAGVPQHARTGREINRPVTVACSDLLAANVPRVRTARLREWIPNAIAEDADLPEWLPLPAHHLALLYHPETVRELLVEPKPAAPAPASDDTLPAAGSISTPAADSSPDRKSDAAPPAPRETSPPANQRIIPSWKRILKPILGPSAEELEEVRRRLHHPENITPTPADKPPAGISLSDAIPEPEITPPSATPPLPVVVPIAPIPPAPAPPPEIHRSFLTNADALQALFMTENDLSLQDVADRSAVLPGLQGCVLTSGEDLRLSADIPAGFDVRAIRDQMLALLDSAPETLSARGTPRTPALTLHFDQGPLSILRHGDASLLVVHQDRGFIPGVREKLSNILEALQETRSSEE